MDMSRYGLRGQPFPTTPDHRCYYPSTSCERALALLLPAIKDGDGLMLLTGDAGTGKTLLCHCIMDQCANERSIVFLTNSRADSPKDLFQAILYDLSLPYENGDTQELRLRVTDWLLNQFSESRQTLMIIDEAQLLSADLLEELRLLGNLEAGERKAVQILLVGQTPVLEVLAQPSLASLQQRLCIRTHVNQMEIDEAIDYVMHHVRIAGGEPQALFSDEALEILANETAGTARLLNQAARRCLTLCDELDLEQVDAEVALEAVSIFGGAHLPKEDLLPLTDETVMENDEETVVAYPFADAPRRPA